MLDDVDISRKKGATRKIYRADQSRKEKCRNYGCGNMFLKTSDTGSKAILLPKQDRKLETNHRTLYIPF